MASCSNTQLLHPHPKLETGSESIDHGNVNNSDIKQQQMQNQEKSSGYLAPNPCLMKKSRRERVCTAKERISRMPPCAAGKRSSIYRGVTRHRWTGRYEAHLWDKTTWNQNQNKKGKQVYLGAYDDEEAAARAYDLAALKYWGAGTLINFPVTDYSRDLEEMQMISKEDYLVSLRRKSSAFSRGFPKYRGISRQSQSKWESPFSQMLGCSNADASAEGKYGSGTFGVERKIDLTPYIKWWTPKKSHQADCTEELSRELRALECSSSSSEPYKLPTLGLPKTKSNTASQKGLSACDILSKSAAFKNFVEKSSAIQETTIACSSKEMDHGKGVAPLLFPSVNDLEFSKPVGIAMGMSDLPVQRAPYTLSPIFSHSLKNNWNAVDSVPDPLFWSSLVQPSGQSVADALQKNDTGSGYSYRCQE